MDNNFYYSPESFGLVMLGEIEYTDNSYRFDTRIFLYKQETGEMFTARDSGCSCPTPFEDSELEHLRKADKDSMLSEAKECCQFDSQTSLLDAIELINRVFQLVQ